VTPASVFSMAVQLAEKLAFDLVRPASEALQRSKALPLGIPSIDEALPDGGLPRGAVVELTSMRGLGRATSFALSACASAQALARLRSGDDRTVGAWCAYLDPDATLYAPGVIRAGVDLRRLLVVRPDPSALGRVAVRVAASRAFSLLVVDTASLPGVDAHEKPSLDRWANVVRRLALSIERSDTTVLLLTDASAHRSVVLPTAMRIELNQSSVGSARNEVLTLRVAKDRQGRVGGTVPVSLSTERRAS